MKEEERFRSLASVNIVHSDAIDTSASVNYRLSGVVVDLHDSVRCLSCCYL